ncbi:hypothetical protein H9P43_000741 [Blastocladiella emersonii ATCC 22665]|nr:hypothetical protein H9P43_000741 [Blastocladiella emersonii ATCC 22665]
MATTSVKVALRVRPLTAKETLANCSECISYIAGEPQVIIGSDRSFTFDHVFSPDTPQANLYDESIAPLLAKFLEGYNATVLAYGQTGSGKTYSMGTGLDGNVNTENQGIVPRAIHALFAELPHRYPPPSSAQVSVSFLELYNEELIDLLNPALASARIDARPGSAPPPSRPASAAPWSRGMASAESGDSALRIREDEYGNIVWVGVREEVCGSPEQLLGLLNKGSLCRTTGSTDMNMVSSRSHAIFSVTLRLNKVDTDGLSEKITCKFHFVDLAGSERLKKTNAEGARAKEGIAINSGLLALGNVISALGDESRLEKGVGHVPYRDSKLTRLLQDSLGGNSQTMMLACVSPADSNFQETLNTLKYANRARNIKNKVTINQQTAANSVEVQQLRTQIGRLKLELSTLKEQYGLGGAGGGGGDGTGSGLAGSRGGSYENLKMHENHAMANASLRVTISDLQNERDKLEFKIQQLQSRIKKLEQQLLQIQAERDTLLLEKNGWSLPAPAAAHPAVDGEDAVMTDADPAAMTVNPLVTSYLTKITELQHDLAEREQELAVVRQQAALVSSAAAGLDRHRSMSMSMGGSNGGGRAPKPFRFVLPGSAEAAGQDTTIQATLDRAREQCQEDMKFLLQANGKGLLATGSGGGTGSAAGGGVNALRGGSGSPDQGGYDDQSVISEVERPMVFGGALEVPTWAKTPSVIDGGSGGGGGGQDDAQSSTSVQQPPEVLYQALHKIQADLQIKEELMTQLEATQREYVAMKDTYEDKFSQLQNALQSIRTERDLALERIQGNPRENPRDVRAKYEAKVKQLLGEISALRRNHIEATKTMASSKKAEFALRQLKLSVEALKAEKHRLIKKMREDADKSRDQALAAEREIQKLRRKERMATEMAKKFERNFELQKVLLKRRAEEIVATHQKLKTVTNLLKRTAGAKAISKLGLAGIGATSIAAGSSGSGGGGFGAGGRRGSASSVAASVFGIGAGGGNSRPISSMSATSFADEQSEIALSYRKHQLYKEMEAVVTGQQLSRELEQLVTKRKRLMDEKHELLNERERVVAAEAERNGVAPDPSAPQYMDDRLEAIDAELHYVEVRIKTVTDEAAKEDAGHNGNGVSGYDAVVQLVRTLNADEATALLQTVVDDYIQVQITARNQGMEVQRQESQIDGLRKNLLLMRKTAMKNAVDYEKRIKTMAVNNYLQSATIPASASAMDQLMDISVFTPSAAAGATPTNARNGGGAAAGTAGQRGSRATSPTMASSRRQHHQQQQDDDAMSIASSTSSSPVKGGGSIVYGPDGHPVGPREYRSMSISSAGSAATAMTTSTTATNATARRRPVSSASSQDVFERLSKTFTVASQLKVRDTATVTDANGNPIAGAAGGSSLTRRESHERLNQSYGTGAAGTGSGSTVNLAQIDEEGSGSTARRPSTSPPPSAAHPNSRRPGSTTLAAFGTHASAPYDASAGQGSSGGGASAEIDFDRPAPAAAPGDRDAQQQIVDVVMDESSG